MTLRFGGSRFTPAHQRCFVVGNQTRTPRTQAHRRQSIEVESERVGSSRRAEVQVVREGRAIFQQSQTIHHIPTLYDNFDRTFLVFTHLMTAWIMLL